MKYLEIEYGHGSLKITQQHPTTTDTLYGQDFIGSSGVKLTSCDCPEVRLRHGINKLFVRGCRSTRAQDRFVSFDVEFNLNNIVRINQAVMEFNRHMEEKYGRL